MLGASFASEGNGKATKLTDELVQASVDGIVGSSLVSLISRQKNRSFYLRDGPHTIPVRGCLNLCIACAMLDSEEEYMDVV